MAGPRDVPLVPNEAAPWRSPSVTQDVIVLNDFGGVQLDGQPAPVCSTGEAAKLYARFGWIREQVDQAVRVSGAPVSPEGLAWRAVEVRGEGTGLHRSTPRARAAS